MRHLASMSWILKIFWEKYFAGSHWWKKSIFWLFFLENWGIGSFSYNNKRRRDVYVTLQYNVTKYEISELSYIAGQILYTWYIVKTNYIMNSFYRATNDKHKFNSSSLMAQICISVLCEHCFRKWLVACSATNHYLNQCSFIGNWTNKNKLLWNSNQNTNFFIKGNAFKNVDCEVVTILSRRRSVKACNVIIISNDMTLLYSKIHINL